MLALICALLFATALALKLRHKSEASATASVSNGAYVETTASTQKFPCPAGETIFPTLGDAQKVCPNPVKCEVGDIKNQFYCT